MRLSDDVRPMIECLTLDSNADVLGPVLRGGQPVQAAADLHGEDHRSVQGQEAPRGAAPRVRHHRLGLQVHAPG